MPEAYLFEFFGSLLGVFIFQRIILRLCKKINPPRTRLIVAWIILLLVNAVVGGMGAADGGAFAPVEAVLKNIPAIICWLAYDIYHLRKTGDLEGKLYPRLTRAK